MKGNQKYFLAILILSLLFALPVFFEFEKSLFTGDNDIYWPVSRFFIFDSFHETGEIPLWNPNVYGGIPLLANPQSIMVFPLYFLFALLDFGFVLKIALFFLVFVSGISMFYFLKTLGLKNESALFGAIAYMFSGRIMSSIWAGHIVFWPPFALLPLVFAFFELALKNRSFPYAIFAGVILALMFLGGHTQLFLYFLMFFSFYALFKIITEAEKQKTKNSFFPFSISFNSLISSAKKIIPFFFLILLVFSAISMIQIIPSLEFASFSSREGGLSDEFANFAAFPLQNFITVLLPNFFGNSINHTFWGKIYYDELNFFPGIIVLIFALFSFLFFRNNLVKFFSLIVLFCFIYAFGSKFFLFDFFRLFPIFELFRVPSRMLFVAAFCVPVIAAIGFNGFLNQKQLSQSQKNYFKLIFVFSIIAGILLIISILFKEQIFELGKTILMQKYALHSPEKQLYYISQIPAVFNWILRDLSALFLASFFSVAAIFFFRKQLFSKKTLSFVLIAVCFLELFSFGSIFINDLRTGEIFESNKAIEFLESQDSYFRIFEHKMFPWYHKTVSAGIQSALSYDPAIFRKYADFLGLINNKNVIDITTIQPGDISDESNLKVFDLLNVKYIVSEKKLELISYPLAYYDRNYFIYENPNVLPRAFVVGKSKVFSSEEQVLENILSDSFNPRQEVLLFNASQINSLQSFKEAEITHYSPHKITVSVDAEDECFLVLLENNYPGWKAFENGKQIELFTANYLFRAVKLSPGKHELDFLFQSESIFLGGLISIASLFLVILFLLINFKNRKK
ncbi:MAG: YfhO family protein [Candidatus Diapherotrites archaeon]